MATVVNKADPTVFHVAANTPDFDPGTWLVNPPSFATLHGTVAPKYWKVVGSDIAEMSAAEKTTVDDAEAAAATTANRSEAIADTSEVSGEGVRVRALIELLNKRDNYLVNRVAELQAALDAVKATSGSADNIRAAIPASWLATDTRTKADAITDYTDDINAGNQDT